MGAVRVAGSSPRIRGECHDISAEWSGRGIIPANTGRISFTVGLMLLMMDHPREYGENAIDLNNAAIRVGSSPRIRGEYLLT